jgi:hypothetical protein
VQRIPAGRRHSLLCCVFVVAIAAWTRCLHRDTSALIRAIHVAKRSAPRQAESACQEQRASSATPETEPVDTTGPPAPVARQTPGRSVLDEGLSAPPAGTASAVVAHARHLNRAPAAHGAHHQLNAQHRQELLPHWRRAAREARGHAVVLAAGRAGGLVDDTGRVSRACLTEPPDRELTRRAQLPHSARPLRPRCIAAQAGPGAPDRLYRRALDCRLLVHGAAVLRLSQRALPGRERLPVCATIQVYRHMLMPTRPALTSSALGLISIAYNFLGSRAYVWGTSAITGTVISSSATLLYGALLLWTHHRIVRLREAGGPRQLWSNETYYTHFVQNTYPTAVRSAAVTPDPAISEDDRVNQQMALLLRKSDSRPSPDPHSTTFHIDLPEDTEQLAREACSQELVGTPGQAHAGWNRGRADSRPDSLSEQQAWERWQDRGRTTDRPTSSGQRSNHSRGLSREERRREIELGHP